MYMIIVFSNYLIFICECHVISGILSPHLVNDYNFVTCCSMFSRPRDEILSKITVDLQIKLVVHSLDKNYYYSKG